MSGRHLTNLLRDPARAANVTANVWNGLIAAARAERLLATLALRIDAIPVPDRVRAIFDDALLDAGREKRITLWEADQAAAALAPLGITPILLKGAAYVAAGLKAGEGRMIGDLDILVPRNRLDEAEAAVLDAGWEWVKPDPYDDVYYRRWMHELPPLIHRERDRMIDVHHTILPLTARVRPDAAALIADSVGTEQGWRVLSPEDRVCHAVAHMFADGDLNGGLRNLWDIHCLLNDIRDGAALERRAARHGLSRHLARAQRLADHVYGERQARLTAADYLFLHRLLTRDGWGRDSAKLLGLAFYARSHLLRMPPLMLARHIFTKWRKGHRRA